MLEERKQEILAETELKYQKALEELLQTYTKKGDLESAIMVKERLDASLSATEASKKGSEEEWLTQVLDKKWSWEYGASKTNRWFVLREGGKVESNFLNTRTPSWIKAEEGKILLKIKRDSKEYQSTLEWNVEKTEYKTVGLYNPEIPVWGKLLP